MFVFAVQVLELGRVEVTFRFAVLDKRVIVPVVPKSVRNFDKLGRPVVAGIVLVASLASKVEGVGNDAGKRRSAWST
jgi:hypothetical protein